MDLIHQFASFIEEAMDTQSEAPPTPSLKQQQIQLLPLVEGAADSCCSICLSDTAHQQVKKLPCGHTYHAECIDTWLGQNHTCPVCRASLLESKQVSSPQSISQLLESRVYIPPSRDTTLQQVSITTLKKLIQLRGLSGLMHRGMERSHLESLLSGAPPSTTELVQLALEKYPRQALRGLERGDLVRLL